jgi:hypothetical protein
MLTGKKTVILAAVILALIMVVPASYIIFSDMNSHKALPVIYTSNSESAQNWTLNFYGAENQTSGLNTFHPVNENASFVQPGYNQSFLNLSMPFIHEYPNGGPTGNALTFALPFLVTGSVMASALPTGVMISYSTSLPPGPDSPQPFYMLQSLGDGAIYNATEVNVSGFAGWTTQSHVIQLVNQSHYNGRGAYRFSFFDGATPEFYGIKPDHPFNFDLNFTLLGLSRPVYDIIDFVFMDVNSTAGSTGFASTDSHPYDSTQNSYALINFQSPHMKVAYCESLLQSSSSPLSTAGPVTGSIIQDSISASTRSYDVLLPQIHDAESEWS